jgi:hypothetical protein
VGTRQARSARDKCRRGIELTAEQVRRPPAVGVVANRRSSTYRTSEPGWIKIRNRDCWRYEMERESAITNRRRRMFV